MANTMLGLYWNGRFANVEERPVSEHDEKSARVAVHLAGVCATDLEITRGYMNFRGILGHEFVGHVEAGPSEWLGQRVVGEINFSCGECELCREGLDRHCSNRKVMGILDADGAMAESVVVPVRNLHRVPNSVTDEAAVFTEPLAAAFEIREQLDIRDTENCLVFGDGRLGQLISQVLHDAGARVQTIGRHPEKLSRLAARGIETMLIDDWNANTDPGRADIAVEATGSAEALRAALESVRPRGKVVMKSTTAAAHEIDLAPLVINEIQLVGSRCGPFAPALAALAESRIDVEAMIDERFALERADRALEYAATRGVLKVLIDCHGAR